MVAVEKAAHGDRALAVHCVCRRAAAHLLGDEGLGPRGGALQGYLAHERG